MASLFEAIVMQNLSVLTRGNTLRPHVLLLGGPNTLHHAACSSAWQHNIPKIWKERKTRAARGRRPEGADHRPRQRAVLRGARRRASSARPRTTTSARYTRLPRTLEWYIDVGPRRGEASRAAAAAWRRTRTSSRPSRSATAPEVRRRHVRARRGGRGLRRPRRRLDLHQGRAHGQGQAQRPRQEPTSSPRATPSRTRWRCSPSSSSRSRDQGATLKVLGVGTTGYAKDILKDVLGADVALVETVAHTEAGAALLRRRRT